MTAPIEIGKNITVSGKDLVKGLFPSLGKLARDPGLEFTVKARVAAIVKELGKQAQEFEKAYELKCAALKWEGEGPQRRCVEQEKLDQLNTEFEEKTFVVVGRKLRAKQIEQAKGLSAHDLMALEPILDDVF